MTTSSSSSDDERLEVETPSATPVKIKRVCCTPCVIVVVVVLVVVFILVLVVGVGVGVGLGLGLKSSVDEPASGDSFQVGGRVPVSLADHVYAVNAAAKVSELADLESPWRKKAPIASDGTFTLELEKGFPWIVMFLDTTKSGSSMIVGILRAANNLNTLYPTSTASSETALGAVSLTVAADFADVGTDFATLAASLGMTSSEAVDFGGRDSSMLRYCNPDLDDDGTMDMDQNNLPTEIVLDFEAEYLFGDHRVNYITDYLKTKTDLPSTNVPLQFFRFGHKLTLIGSPPGAKPVFLQYPQKWILEWSDPGEMWVSYAEHNSTHQKFSPDWSDPQQTQPLTATWNYGTSRGGGYGIGLMARFVNISQPPEGTFTYKIWSNETMSDGSPAVLPDETLTFTRVNSPNTRDTDGFVFPFFVATTDGGGYITGFSYTWKEYDLASRSFIDTTPKTLELRMGKAWVNIDYYGTSMSGLFGAAYFGPCKTTPPFALSGTVTSDPNVPGPRMLLSELNSLSFSFYTMNGISRFKATIEDTTGILHSVYYPLFPIL